MAKGVRGDAAGSLPLAADATPQHNAAPPRARARFPAPAPNPRASKAEMAGNMTGRPDEIMQCGRAYYHYYSLGTDSACTT
jgi:hypothetical protein